MARSRRSSTEESLSEASETAGRIDDAAAPQDSESPSRERIAERAYQLYCERGRADGADCDDWLAAERELANGHSRRDQE
jgi:hypothetical protein